MSPDRSLVSVIVPTYNRSESIGRAIRFVLAQTWRPIQLIVVNDGSSDETKTVLDSITEEVRAAGVDPAFIHKENGGVSSARNAGLLEVRGSYIAFLDDDDEWYPDKLKLQMARLAETSARLCCCLLATDGDATFPKDADHLITGANPEAYVEGTLQASIVSLLVRTELAREAGPFHTDLKTGEDFLWIAGLAHIGEFCAVGEVLGRIGKDEDSLTRARGYDSLIAFDTQERVLLLKIREVNRDHAGWNEQAWRRRVAREFDEFTKHRLYGGELTEARKLYDEAVNLTDGADPLPRTRRKLRKARWLALIGRRLKHPKFDSLKEI